MEFFSLLIFIVVGVVVVAGVFLWLSRRKRGQHGDDPVGGVIYHDDRPQIRRYKPEAYTGPSRHESIPFNVSDELRSIQGRLKYLEGQIESLAGMVRELYGAGGNFRTQPVRGSGQTASTGRGAAASQHQQPREHADFLDVAKESYRTLSADGLRNLSVEPLFVFLDVDESARGSAIGEAQRIFKQSDNKQNAFVIFPKGDREGWLFPNPRISYTESMRYVFPNLSYENFTESKYSVEPTRVRRTAEGVWEMSVT